MKTGKLIVYTSADSVFQIAAHEDVVPPEELWHICEQTRAMLQGEHGVGRVIARPFIGRPGAFTRTGNRRDFSITPAGDTMLDVLKPQRPGRVGRWQNRRYLRAPRADALRPFGGQSRLR